MRFSDWGCAPRWIFWPKRSAKPLKGAELAAADQNQSPVAKLGGRSRGHAEIIVAAGKPERREAGEDNSRQHHSPFARERRRYRKDQPAPSHRTGLRQA
jgi:hypothetical protein